MSDYDLFRLFNYIDWVKWIKNTTYGRPTNPQLGYSEVQDNLTSAYNYLVRNKIDNDDFIYASLAVLNDTPKDPIYALELFNLLQLCSLVKSEEYVDFLEKLFLQNTFEDLFFDEISLHELLINILATYRSVKVKERLKTYFIDSLKMEKRPSFYALGLRFYYKNNRDSFFLYAEKILERFNENSHNIDYIDSLVIMLDEMALVLQNYNEILFWIIEQKNMWEKENKISYVNFIKLSRLWLHENNKELKHFEYAKLLGSLINFLYCKDVLENCYDLKSVVNLIISTSGIVEPTKAVTRFIVQLLVMVYPVYYIELNSWSTDSKLKDETTENEWRKIMNFLQIVQNKASVHIEQSVVLSITNELYSSK